MPKVSATMITNNHGVEAGLLPSRANGGCTGNDNSSKIEKNSNKRRDPAIRMEQMRSKKTKP